MHDICRNSNSQQEEDVWPKPLVPKRWASDLQDKTQSVEYVSVNLDNDEPRERLVLRPVATRPVLQTRVVKSPTQATARVVKSPVVQWSYSESTRGKVTTRWPSVDCLQEDR